jgi:hypothetical protein
MLRLFHTRQRQISHPSLSGLNVIHTSRKKISTKSVSHSWPLARIMSTRVFPDQPKQVALSLLQ